MYKFILRHKWVITGIVLGAIGGFLYWKYIGCSSGGCMITSRWYNSTVYGALLGFLFTSSFKKKDKADKLSNKFEEKDQ
jgi:hypothetical protein